MILINTKVIRKRDGEKGIVKNMTQMKSGKIKLWVKWIFPVTDFSSGKFLYNGSRHSWIDLRYVLEEIQ